MNRTIAVMGLLLCVASTSVAATFVVTSNADSGAGTLRDAINQANVTAGVDTINFNIAGTPLITLASALPTITEAVTIDGLTQPGAPLVPHVEINGNGFQIFTINVNAGTATIVGFALNRATVAVEVAIPVVDPTTVGRIAISYIGLDLSGTTALPNTQTGILVSNGNFSIDTNVISGNSGPGVTIAGASDAGANGSFAILENIIGLNAAGTAAVPNAIAGVRIGFAASGLIRIRQGNTISGNTGSGIFIDAGTTLVIEDNNIGTDVSGNVAIGNGVAGIFLSPNGPVTSTIRRNLISGNTGRASSSTGRRPRPSRGIESA